jgi:hypothetical protein
LFLTSREVEDFARRLNSVWPERMHLEQDRRIESHIGGNGSLQRFTGNFLDENPGIIVVKNHRGRVILSKKMQA